jgi:cytoskeletal protein CcmA (bactofilin family)
MAEKVKPTNDFSINTIIGPGTKVTGTVLSAGFTRIDGAIEGDIAALGRVVVGERARIKSDIRGTFVTIGGVVYGNIIASEKLVVLSTGLIKGNIVTRNIKADFGCLLHGRIYLCDSDEKFDEAEAALAGATAAVSAKSAVGQSAAHG